MEKKYPLFDIYWDEDDLEMVSNVIKRGSYWAIGPEIPEFEKGCELLCKERTPVDKSLLRKSFSILKYFTNF